MPEDTTQTIDENDWAAAMAEQATPAAPSPEIFPELSGTAASGGLAKDIDFILDIPVLLTVELGRTKIAIKNLLQLAQGSVVELDGLAGEPMDVLVNGCLIAQGEVVATSRSRSGFPPKRPPTRPICRLF